MTASSIPLEIAIIRNDENWPEGLDAIAETAVLTAVQMSGAKIKGACEISILLTDDAEQHELNKQWRDKDSSTNVLSFPQIEPFTPLIGILGDIVLARETLEREAVEGEKSFSDHFTHLVVHGFLHVLGYDHIEEAQAVTMESLETAILERLGISDPYAD